MCCCCFKNELLLLIVLCQLNYKIVTMTKCIVCKMNYSKEYIKQCNNCKKKFCFFANRNKHFCSSKSMVLNNRYCDCDPKYRVLINYKCTDNCNKRIHDNEINNPCNQICSCVCTLHDDFCCVNCGFNNETMVSHCKYCTTNYDDFLISDEDICDLVKSNEELFEEIKLRKYKEIVEKKKGMGNLTKAARITKSSSVNP